MNEEMEVVTISFKRIECKHCGYTWSINDIYGEDIDTAGYTCPKCNRITPNTHKNGEGT